MGFVTAYKEKQVPPVSCRSTDIGSGASRREARAWFDPSLAILGKSSWRDFLEDKPVVPLLINVLVLLALLVLVPILGNDRWVHFHKCYDCLLFDLQVAVANGFDSTIIHSSATPPTHWFKLAAEGFLQSVSPRLRSCLLSQAFLI